MELPNLMSSLLQHSSTIQQGKTELPNLSSLDQPSWMIQLGMLVPSMLEQTPLDNLPP